MVIQSNDPRIAPADLRQADQESDAVQRRHTRRRIEALEAQIVRYETEIAYLQREVNAALEKANVLDGASTAYVINGERS
jgi:hypothetical protein